MNPKIFSLEKFDSLNKSDKLKLIVDESNSKQFKNCPSYILDAFQKEEITYNYHVNGFYPEVFEENSFLNENYTLIATTTDRNGVEYAAIYEHK